MSLESRYRWLLRAYPRGYQARRGEEMLATLMECARPGQLRPTSTEVTDVLRAALRERLGLAVLPGLDAGLRLAGPVAATVAAALAVGAWVLGLRDPAITVAAVGWLLAVVATVAGRLVVPARVVAAVVTLGAVLVDPGLTFGVGWATSNLGPLLVACGLIAALAGLVDRPRPSLVERWVVVPAVVAAVVAWTERFNGYLWLADPTPPWTNQPFWVSWLWLVPVALLVVGAAQLALGRGTGPLWAAAVLAVPLPWASSASTLATFRQLPLRTAYVVVTTPTLNAVAIGAAVLAVAVARRARSTGDPVDAQTTWRRVGGLSLGAAGGLAVLALLVLTAQESLAPRDLAVVGAIAVAAAVASARPGAAWRVPVLSAAAAATVVVWGIGDMFDSGLLIVVVLLVVVAAAAPRPSRRSIVVGALGTVVFAAGLTLALAGWSAAPDYLLYELSALVAPAVATAIFLPTTLWTAVTVVRSGRTWTGAAVGFVVAFEWVVGYLWPAVDPIALDLVAALLVLGLVAGRTITWWRDRSRMALAGD